ncbi:MAG TPA: hypothetical protein VFW90_04345 [Candidatus Saccharimonadales bacterium]|nr:hypothetical protein [Candidatus Saccharimonadales bacterium]
MKLDSRTLRMALIGGILALGLAFFIIAFAGISALGNKSRQMVDLKVKNQTLENQLANLVQSKRQVEKYSYFKQVADSVIPNDKNQADAVVQIFNMANQSGIDIQSISFPSSSLGSSGTTSAASASAKSAISQAKSVPGFSGLYSLELTITPSSGKDVPASKQVTFDKMISFLKKVEGNRRTAQITQVSIQPNSGDAGFSFTLVINIFLRK